MQNMVVGAGRFKGVKGDKGVNRRCGASAEGKLVCTMPSREEEKTPKGD